MWLCNIYERPASVGELKTGSINRVTGSYEMPDWKAELAERLSNLRIAPERESAIIDELVLPPAHRDVAAERIAVVEIGSDDRRFKI